MASGTIRSSFTGDYGLEIRWSSVPDVATNTSQVTVKVYMLYPSINVSKRSGCYTTIDGKKVEFTAAAIKNEYKGETLIKTRTETVFHESDGTKKIQLVAYYPVYLNSESYGWIYEKKASGTATLDDIPRSSSIVSQTAAVTANGTDKWSVLMSRHSEAFYHKATLTIGDRVYVTEPFATSAEYVIPTEWLNAIPDTMRGTVDVSIQTYSDSTCETAVGDAIISSFEIAVPSSAAPVIGEGWATVSPYNTGVVSGSTFDGVYVQGYSQAEVTFDESKVSAQYGADIVSTQILWDGNTADKSPYRTQALSRSGNQAIRCIVTDSRGLRRTKDITINVLPYAKPALNNISIYRSTAGGTASDTGTYIYFKATGIYSDLNGRNSLTIKAAYRPVGTSGWTEYTIESGTGAAKGTVSTTNSYDARITATDALGNTATFSAVVPTAEVAFNIKPGGKGAAFGKYAELENVLDVVFMTRLSGGILNPVLPAKTDLNDILIPNTYTGAEASKSGYLNCPITSGSFSLDVVGMGDDGQVKQRLQLCSSAAPVTYERFHLNVQSIDVTGKNVEFEANQYTDINVDISVEPVQSGSGDPAPDNIRKITGFDSARLTHNDAAYTVNLGQTVYGGTLDLDTGLLTINKKLYTFDGTEAFSRLTDTTNQKQSNVFFYKITDAAKVGLMSSVCSHFKNTNDTVWSETYDGKTGIYCDNYAGSSNYNNKYFRWGNGSNTVAEFKSFLAAQYAAGTPVQICYEIAEPITVQLMAQKIYALPGRNTFSCDAGEINVRSVDGWSVWMNTMLYNYPIGSFYTSSDPTSPAEIMGGVWIQIKDRFILAAGDTYAAGSMGGEASHTLTENELPVIDGTIAVPVVQDHATSGVTGHAYGANDGAAIWNPSSSRPGITGTKSTSGSQYGYGYKFGGGEAHNNMPPYLAAYIWQRIA